MFELHILFLTNNAHAYKKTTPTAWNGLLACLLASYCAVLCYLHFFLLGCLLTRFAVTLDVFISLDGAELIRYPCRSRCDRLLQYKKDYKVVFKATLKLYNFLRIRGYVT